MAKNLRQPNAPKTIASQPNQVGPAQNQALTDRYLELHAQPGSPAARSPSLQAQVDASTASRPAPAGDMNAPTSVVPGYPSK